MRSHSLSTSRASCETAQFEQRFSQFPENRLAISLLWIATQRHTIMLYRNVKPFIIFGNQSQQTLTSWIVRAARRNISPIL